MIYDILLIAETFNGRILQSAYELLEFGRQFISTGFHRMALVVPGSGISPEAESIGKNYGIDIIAVENKYLGLMNPEVLQKAVKEVINRFEPLFICFIHSVTGSAVASALAAETGASCITGIESFTDNGGMLSFRRNIFGGRVTVEVSSLEKRCVLTMLPGSYAQCEETGKCIPDSAAVTVIKFDYEPSGLFLNDIISEEAGSFKLDEAEVIISAGRGIGNIEHIGLIERISGIFMKSAVGASRPVCDMGWLPYGRQVGITGKTVSPKLYVACGISGSPQHVAGMKNSGIIVAINTDPGAAIVSLAHYIIIEDLVPFLILLEEKYNESYRDTSFQ